MASAAAYGGSTPELLANYDPATSSWRTCQRSLVEGWTVFSETWPRSGMMRNGIAYRLPPLVPLTSETASGSWPTPTVSGNYNRKGSSKTSGDGLATAVRRWPTPVASMHKGSSPAALTRRSGASRQNDRLDHAVMASDGGSLNPTWVEWLMGFPPSWTEL